MRRPHQTLSNSESQSLHLWMMKKIVKFFSSKWSQKIEFFGKICIIKFEISQNGGDWVLMNIGNENSGA